jgi:hypothetical protein
MVEQHSKRWAEYQAMRNNHELIEDNLKLFFKQSKVDAFIERRSKDIGRKKVFAIDVSIVDGIIKDFFNPTTSEDEAEHFAAPHGELAMNVFESEFVTCESNGDI